jgi:hypothetical protein
MKTENEIHKVIISYGFYPMTLVLKDLEEREMFEECALILNAMKSYRDKFKIVTDEIPTKWTLEFEKEYFSYFKKVDESGKLIAKENLNYYLKDIYKRLELF